GKENPPLRNTKWGSWRWCRTRAPHPGGVGPVVGGGGVLRGGCSSSLRARPFHHLRSMAPDEHPAHSHGYSVDAVDDQWPLLPLLGHTDGESTLQVLLGPIETLRFVGVQGEQRFTHPDLLTGLDVQTDPGPEGHLVLLTFAPGAQTPGSQTDPVGIQAAQRPR